MQEQVQQSIFLDEEAKAWRSTVTYLKVHSEKVVMLVGIQIESNSWAFVLCAIPHCVFQGHTPPLSESLLSKPWPEVQCELWILFSQLQRT